MAVKQFVPIATITRKYFPLTATISLKYVWRQANTEYYVLENNKHVIILDQSDFDEILTEVAFWESEDFRPDVTSSAIPIRKSEKKIVMLELTNDPFIGEVVVTIRLWFRDYKNPAEYKPSPIYVELSGKNVIKTFTDLKQSIETNLKNINKFKEILRHAYIILGEEYQRFRSRDITKPSTRRLLSTYLTSVSDDWFCDEWNRLYSNVEFAYHFNPSELIRFIKDKCTLDLDSFIREEYEEC